MNATTTSRAVIGVLILSAGAATAQDFDVTVDTKTSVVSIDAGTSLDTSGFLIGDYDPETNPDGTQTRPGFFGGSGNQPIDTITTIDTETELDALPSGAMSLSLDTAGGVGVISDFFVDLFNGQDASTDLSVTIGFDTFHTVDPSFLYIGGVPITIPLGEVGAIRDATLTQDGPAAITLTPTGDPEIQDLAGVVAARLNMTVSISLPGGEDNEFLIEDLPVLVPLDGQIEDHGDGTALISLSAAPDPVSGSIPIEDLELPSIPFELPTLGEETAGVLFTLSPQSLAYEMSLVLSINANAQRQACPADMNGDGELNFFDVSSFLNAYGASDPSADFTGDGALDFFDVSAFLSAYSAGCP